MTTAAGRVFYGSACTVTLERITVRGGYVTTSSPQGGGLMFTTNSRVTLSSCTVRNNQTYGQWYGEGGGLYITGGVLNVYNCSFSSNATRKVDWSSGSVGGGISARNASVTITNTTFRGNWSWTRHYYAYGGALHLAGGTAAVAACDFQYNYTLNEGNSDSPGPALGGAIYASGVNALSVDDCFFRSNRCTMSGGSLLYGQRTAGCLYLTGGAYGGALFVSGVSPVEVEDAMFTSNRVHAANVYGTRRGGAVYLKDAAGAFTRCVVTRNGVPGQGTAEVFVEGGTVGLTNLLLAYGATSNGLENAGGAVTVGNATIVTNRGWGVRSTSGSLTLRNSIVRDNAAGDLDGCTNVAYSCLRGPVPGPGNLDADPLFVDLAHFHLQSRAGHHAGGFFQGGVWETARQDSPLLDRGDPAAPYAFEPLPNGSRLNLGAYGNTAVASKTVRGGSVLVLW